MSYYIYIVRCKDNSLYTGYTRDINRRVNEHNFSRFGSKSLRGKLPVKLVYSENFNNLSDALRREKEIKGWRREKKENLVKLMRLR